MSDKEYEKILCYILKTIRGLECTEEKETQNTKENPIYASYIKSTNV